MNLHVFIPIAGIIASIAVVLYHLFFQINKLKKLGNCQLILTRKKGKALFFILILILMCLMFALLFIRRFSLFITLILTATAVLAVELSFRDHILQKLNGVYENGLITGGRFLLKDEIVSFPTLAYENDSDGASSVPPQMLKTVTKNNGVIFLEFTNPEERNNAVYIMKNWVD